jgi:phenylpyruvate tautomerase PptA (4-oxalocrotonate tautomerase family)
VVPPQPFFDRRRLRQSLSSDSTGSQGSRQLRAVPDPTFLLAAEAVETRKTVGMPAVQIDVLDVWSVAERSAIAEAVQQALVAILGVPERDRFQVIRAHPSQDFVFDRGYLEIERSDRFVMVTVTLAAGRSTEAKQAFYAQLCQGLVSAVGLRPEDLAVALVENQREDWSFGLGEASYLTIPRERWR